MDTEALIGFDEMDAVVLCTPNHLHEEMAVQVLDSGKSVLVERPIAITSSGAARVVEAAERTGRVLSIGLPHRFRPEAIALRSFVQGAELGTLFAVRGSWLTRTVPANRATWRTVKDKAGGGALIDLGIPALDLCMWIVGFPTPRRVSCITASDGAGLEHSATVTVEAVDGMVMSLEVSNRFFAGDDRYYVRVMGTDGSGWLPPLEVYKQLGGRPAEVTPRQPTPRGGENPYTNAYRRLLDDFVRSVAGLAAARVPHEQVRLMEVVEAAYRSAATGEEVLL
jgi:predicted dehydrogenase